MIQPQTMQATALNQLECQPMDVSEGLRVLDPDAGQIIDVKKTPVIDFADGHPPMRDAIMLPFQQAMQQCSRTERIGIIRIQAARYYVGAAFDSGEASF